MTCATDLAVIVIYPRGAGGKFLINCLSLGTNFSIQHCELAQRQLDGTLASVDIYELLKSRIDAVKYEWSDLDLGDEQLLGKDFIDALELTHSTQIPLPDILQQLIARNYKFPIVAHSVTTLQRLLQVFPNARILALTNTAMFMHQRNDQLSEYWNNVRDASWPRLAPKTQQEFLQLPKFIQLELEGLFQNQIVQYFEPVGIDPTEQEYLHVLKHKKYCVWDCEKFLSDDTEFEKACRELYECFQTSGFYTQHVLQLRKAWLSKLKELTNG